MPTLSKAYLGGTQVRAYLGSTLVLDIGGAQTPALVLGTFNAGTGAIDGGNFDTLESTAEPGKTRFVIDPTFGADAEADGYRFYGDKSSGTPGYSTNIPITGPGWEATSSFANAQGATVNTRVTVYHQSDLTTPLATATDSFVVAIPNLPTAVDDAFEVLSGAAATFDVLANDTDAEGGGLTIAAVGTPSGSGAAGIGAGVVSYTAGASGETDVVTYTVQYASGDQDSATVTVTVVGMTVSDGTGGGEATLNNLSDDDATITVDSAIDAYDGTYIVSRAALAAAPVKAVDPLVLSGTVGNGVITLGYGLFFTDPDKTGGPNGDGTTVLVLEALAGGSAIGTWTWGPVTQDDPSLDQGASGVPDQIRVTVTDGGGDQTVATVDLAAPSSWTVADNGDGTFAVTSAPAAAAALTPADNGDGTFDLAA